MFREQKVKAFAVHSMRTILVLFLLSSFLIGYSNTKATAMSFDSDEIHAGTANYNKVDLSNNDIRLQVGDKGSWENEDAPINLPEITNYPEVQYGPNNTLYVLPGNGTGHFLRYWIEERRWENLATLPFANFTRLISDGSRYFYTTASTGYSFYRYDSYTDVWDKMPDTPNELAAGANLEYTSLNGGEIYAFRGGNTGYFWKFSVVNNSWSDLPPVSYLVTNGSAMMWDHGDYIYMVKGWYNYRLYRYQISTGQWVDRGQFYSTIYEVYRSRLIYVDNNRFLSMNSIGNLSMYSASTNTFTAQSYPSSIRQESTAGAYDGNGKFYALIGYATSNAQIRVYDINTQIWDNGQTTNTSYTHEYSAYAVDSTDNLYSISTSYLYRKNLSTGVGTYLSPPMMGIAPYPSATFNGSTNKLYVIKGNGYTDFYSFDIATNSWDPALANFPAYTGAGATLVNGGDGFLYLVRGQSTTTFYRYEIATNIWTTIASAPFSIYLAGYIVKVSGAIYAFSGTDSANNRVAKFDLSAQTWTEDPVGPFYNGWSYGGRFASDDNETIYYLPGPGSTENEDMSRFYSYNTTSKIWKRLANLPDYARGTSRPYLFYWQNAIYTIRGDYDNRLYKWTPTSASFTSSGTFFSKHYDLIQASTYDSFGFNQSGNGNVAIYTRSSDNLSNWDSWVSLSGNNVQSLSRRYFQYKVVLSGDGTGTPIVSNMSLNYSQETAPPSNPSELHAYSEKGGTELTMSGNPRYTYHHPYFEWTTPSDGTNGSGVAGYYVYFGTDDSANPVTEGSYQTTNSYTADTPMTAGDIDYLVIAVKDKLGNVSSSAEMFSYRYWFVSPPSNISVNSQSEFQEGAGSGLDLSDGSGLAKLVHKTTGGWADGDLAKIPQIFKGGGAVYAQGSIYVEMGNNTKYFYRYDLTANQWSRLGDSLDTVSNSSAGSVLCYDGVDYVYLIVGGNSLGFEKYSISRNTWYRLNDLPSPAAAEASMTMISGGQFMMTLMYSTINFLYDPITDSITENAPALGNFITAGNIYFDGTDSVYALMESNWLRKFVISENRWYTLMQTPVGIVDTQNISFDGIGDDLYFFVNRDSQNKTALKYSITDNEFTFISNPPLETSASAYIVSDKSRYVYIFHNTIDGFRQDNFFVRYDTVTDKYTPTLYSPSRGYLFSRSAGNGSGQTFGFENSWPFYTSDWSSVAFDGDDTVYFKSYNEFGSYSVSGQKLLKEMVMPFPNYGHIYYSNGYIYNTIGNGSNRFLRMNVNTWEWQELANTPATISLVYSQNIMADSSGRIYVARGGNTKTFYRYTPGTNSWETLTNSPVNMTTGLTMTYDGTTGIYFTFSNTSSFYKYSTDTNTWSSALAVVSGVVPNYGASTVISNGNIFLIKGGNTKKVSIYNIASNSWSDGPDTPTEVSYNASFVNYKNNFALLYPAGGKSAVWRYNFPSNNYGFNAFGSYTTKSFLIDGVFSYVNLDADVVLPANTSVLFQTRTTADGATWSDWKDTSQVKTINNQRIVSQIDSPVQKNIEIRAILQSFDSYDTPVLAKLTINYYADTTPPNNPTTIKVYNDNSVNHSELVTNTWYNHPSPLIDWPNPGESGGATDGLIGSNIKGYYIYAGPDQQAVPETAGVFVTDSQYNPTLVDPGLYNILIQTVDGSDNVSTETYDSFLYKFDNVKPDKPSIISVDPSGYSRTNSYTFTWPSASDGDLSGVASYCYKSGAISGAFSTEQCQAENSLHNIPMSYQNGANIIYVRTKDVAGNYSEQTTEATFYFSNGAPTPVTNLSVTTAGQNLYTFTWDLPLAYAGNADKLSYYYSINAVPVEENTVRVETRIVERLPAATQPGTNIFYIVARDEAGNIDWNSTASVSFFSNTTAPGIPLNLNISDISSRASNRWGLALSWDSPIISGSGIDHYNVERSADKLIFNKIDSTDTNSYIDSLVEEGKTYYYRIKSADIVGDQSGPSSIVSGVPVGRFSAPPSISEPVTTVGTKNVSVAWTTDRPASGYVHYGTAFGNMLDSKGSLEPTSEHTITISGLEPSTVYYYQLQSFDREYDYELDQSYSILRTFKTNSENTISNVHVSNITISKATIKWDSTNSVRYNLMYGVGTNYGMSEIGESTASSQTINLSNLQNGSVYHFKISSTSSDGSRIDSDDYSFQTLPYPTVSNIKFQPTGDSDNSVLISWSTNVKTTSVVSYQVDANVLEVSDLAMTTEHEIKISGLADNTQYKIYIKGVDEYGNNVASETQTWKTNTDTRSPVISDLKVQVVLDSTDDKAQLIVAWQTDEPATSNVEYGLMTSDKKFTDKTAIDANLTTKHTVVIPGLESAKLYHLRPISGDRSGNVTYGEDTISSIGKRENTVIVIVINVIQNIFGWLKLGKM